MTGQLHAPISQPTAHRLTFIDVMRGIAVLFMIEAHILNSMLDPVFETGFVYEALNLMSGFASASFIFCAGAGFWLALERKGDDFRAFKKPLWHYLRRLLFILALAYWLHLPVFSFQQILQLPREQLTVLLECNVLQLIVATSLFSLLLFFLLPRRDLLKNVYLVSALSIFFSTPAVWSLRPLDVMPMPIALYFAQQPISKFPLFPWSGYLLAGAAFTAFFLKAADKEHFAKIAALVSFAGIFIFLYGSRLVPFELYGYNDWWYTSPAHSLYRLSGVICVFALLYLFQEWIASQRVGAFLINAGQESLFIYVFHLMIVYGSVLNAGLSAFLKDSLSPVPLMLLIAAVTWVSSAIAFMWKYYKKQYPSRAQHIAIALWSLFLLAFSLIPAQHIAALHETFKSSLTALTLL
ncbi:MAG TPA: heparan-alpha-glucosaminide N-acetyltransferase domain-containing protein [Patescibacteria group bacterium]|nr:heparan-alpha-glucosaminide N-acetyltransferase domain-containing protein [Patescibacteria group bacterium]